MRHYLFPIQKQGISLPGKEIEELCGGIHQWYALRANPNIDAARTEKDRYRMETN